MIKAIKTYETSDGETFTDRAVAEWHEATIAVRAWIEGSAGDAEPAVSAIDLVNLINEDPEKARAVLLPLMPVKRPRAVKGKAGPAKKATVAEYEKLLAKDAA